MLKKINYFLQDFKKVKREGSFAQNFLFTFSGNAFYIIIQLLSAPVLSRIYAPEAYGLFGVFNAIIVNIAMVSSMMFPNALILPKSDRQFMGLLHLNLLLVLLSSTLSFLLIFFLGDFFLRLLNAENIVVIKYLLPLGIMLVGINQLISQWIVREKEFKKNLQFGSATGIVIKALNIGFGYVTRGAVVGIVVVEMAGKIIGLLVNTFGILRKRIALQWVKPNREDIVEAAITYVRFPKYVLPGNYLNMFSTQLPVFFLSFAFGNTSLGLYAFAISLLDMPMRLLGNAVSPVFYQKAAEVYRSEKSELTRITQELYTKLLFVGVLPFCFIGVYGDLLFSIVFGDQWQVAGLYAGYMSVFYFFRLISAPLTSIFNVLRQEKKLLIFQVVLFLSRLIAVLAGVWIVKTASGMVFLFSVASTLGYFLLILFIFKLLNVNLRKYVLLTFTVIFIVLAVLWGARTILMSF